MICSQIPDSSLVRLLSASLPPLHTLGGLVFVKDVMRVTLDGVEYYGNAGMFVLLQSLQGSRRDAAFLRSIARGEDSAR
jgi:hypothetical protein